MTMFTTCIKQVGSDCEVIIYILVLKLSEDLTAIEMYRAVACDFQQCGILTSVDSYEPVQPPFKLRNSKWRSVSSLTIIEYSSDKQRL